MRISGSFNRVEVIDHTDAKDVDDLRGRVLVKAGDMTVRIVEQDDGRTLKIFLSEPGDTPYCPRCGSHKLFPITPMGTCDDCGWCG